MTNLMTWKTLTGKTVKVKRKGGSNRHQWTAFELVDVDEATLQATLRELWREVGEPEVLKVSIDHFDIRELIVPED